MYAREFQNLKEILFGLAPFICEIGIGFLGLTAGAFCSGLGLEEWAGCMINIHIQRKLRITSYLKLVDPPT